MSRGSTKGTRVVLKSVSPTQRKIKRGFKKVCVCVFWVCVWCATKKFPFSLSRSFSFPKVNKFEKDEGKWGGGGGMDVAGGALKREEKLVWKE